jgi:hypothetical protein
MTDDVSTYMRELNRVHDEIETGFHHVRMVAMRTYAEGLIRVINQRIGGAVFQGGRQAGKTEMMRQLSKVSHPDYLKCPHCEWETQHGMQGLKSHIGKKHKDV